MANLLDGVTPDLSVNEIAEKSVVTILDAGDHKQVEFHKMNCLVVKTGLCHCNMKVRWQMGPEFWNKCSEYAQSHGEGIELVIAKVLCGLVPEIHVENGQYQNVVLEQSAGTPTPEEMTSLLPCYSCGNDVVLRNRADGMPGASHKHPLCEEWISEVKPLDFYAKCRAQSGQVH